MRAGIYSPYLDTLGGGERYVASVARALMAHGWSVDMESPDKTIVNKLESKFGMSLQGVNVVDSIKRGDGYDLCFWLSDGSVPTLQARKNIVHFQRPFYKVDGKSLINRMKFFRINSVVVNSKFTKDWIDKEFPVDSYVLYPPVDVSKFKSGKKENLILYVGRFSQLEQSKRQDVLLSVFKKLYDSGFKDCKLILAGGSEVGRTSYVDKLKKSASGYPVKIIENPSFKELKDFYARAKVFWSASGYGVNEVKEPQKVEHFGITVVEAMSAGLVPIIYSAGGHKEIVKDGENGLLWNTTQGLLSKTKKLIEDKALYQKLLRNTKHDALKYSYERFEKEFMDLL